MVDTVIQPLFVFPQTERYSRRNQQVFEQSLSHQSHSGSREQLTEPRDLEMRRDGTTQRWGFRFSWPAFVKISALLCRGLGPCVADIAGTRPITAGKTSQPPQFDAGEAVGVWNRLLYLRFSLIATNYVLLDRHRRLIDGIFSPQHQLLSNWDMYREVSSRLQRSPVTCSFYASRVVGRRMHLWFRDERPLFGLAYSNEKWSVWYGLLATNAETANGAVTIEPVLYTAAGVCRLPAPGISVTRVRHTGRQFKQSLDGMLEAAISWNRDTADWRARMDCLVRSPLCEPTYVFDRAALSRDTDWLRHTLRVPAVIAQTVMSRTVIRRNEQEVADVTDIAAARPQLRTRFDLFVSLCEIARRCAPDHRARLENFAGKLLLDEWPPIFR